MDFVNPSSFARHFFAAGSLQAAAAGVNVRRITERVQPRMRNTTTEKEKRS
jgi:hypothetical protein